MATATRTQTRSRGRGAEPLGEQILKALLEEQRVASAEDLVKALARRLRAPVDVAAVEAECERMVRRRELEVLRREDLQILRALDGSPKGATTPELNAAAGLDRRRAYDRCKRMERKIGLLRSEARRSESFVYFFPVTGQVLSAGNYDEIQRVIEDLKEIARRLGIPPSAKITEDVKRTLIEEYRRYFEALRKGKPAKARRRITAFERQLMAVLSETKLSDVTGLFGVRPFHPWTREWRLNRSAGAPDSLIDAIIDWLHDHSEAAGGLPGDVYFPRLPKKAAEGDRGDAPQLREPRTPEPDGTTRPEEDKSAA